VSLLVALAERLQATGGDAPGFLRRVQREHPADFWANLALGNALKFAGPGEAIGYYRVALAIRPKSAVGYYNLGDVLRFQDWQDEAIEYYKQALRIDPREAKAQDSLSTLLKDTARLDEGIDYFRQAVRSDPENFWAHVHLGGALKDAGRLDEAVGHFQKAVALDPKNAAPRNGLRGVGVRQGRGEEVRAEWQKALEAGPPEHDAWFGYAELCLFLGHEDEYRRARRALLGSFRASTDPFTAERTGRACLYLPASDDELRQATVLIDRAVVRGRTAPHWSYPYFLFAKGLAEYRHGRLEGAIWVMKGEAARVLGPAPRLVVAMAEYRQGHREVARKTLAAAVLEYDWSAAPADNRDAWICHLLRREAETLILPELPAFLAGKHRPRDNDERVALLGACQFKGLYRTAAGLYADAFAADPKLAEKAESRFRAARCAALAGCGGGSDAGQLSTAERARWRREAREWLRADLAALARLGQGSPQERAQARQALRRWRADTDLAGTRDAEGLARLPAEEQEEWRKLWAEVEALLRQAQPK
jgi:serine/threonine-protein kinase